MRRRNSTLCSDGPPRKKISSSSNIPSIDIKPGEVLTDLTGKKWKLGKAIGVGGFGEIFLASDIIEKSTESAPHYVAKVETHKNGPLFVEINCYLRIAKRDMIDEWKSKNALDSLGMPVYIASGSHITKDSSKLRFLIIPRFEKDLEEVFQSKKRKFNLKTVLILAIQLIDTLEYIHNNGYVHSDIKASNILLQQSTKEKLIQNAAIRHTGTVPLRSCRIRKLILPHLLRPNCNLKYFDLGDEKVNNKDADQVYLLDYGLASKYQRSNGEHKEFCSDERRAHAGTILFCSLDAHEGAQSRRSDLESLGYNLVYWLSSKLPWMNETDEPGLVHKQKQKCLSNLDEFLKNCFLNSYPKVLYDYFKYLVELEFDEKPDYDYCRVLFKKALKENGYKQNYQFDFDNLEGWGSKQKKTKTNIENKKSPRLSYKLNRIPLTSNLPMPPKLRKKTKNKKVQLNWSKILMDPEIILKQKKMRDRKITENSDGGVSLLNLDLNQLNPTYAMVDVYNKSLDRINSGCSPRYKGESCCDLVEGFTPAMMMVYNRKREREEFESEEIHNSKRMCAKSNRRTNTRAKSRKQVTESKTRNLKTVSDAKKDVAKRKPPVNPRVYRLRG